jgi:hypothetical protein
LNAVFAAPRILAAYAIALFRRCGLQTHLLALLPSRHQHHDCKNQQWPEQQCGVERQLAFAGKAEIL